MVLLKQRWFRRVALACLAACGAFPSSAEALMPWNGAGLCTAMDAPCVRVFDADYRDYTPAAADESFACEDQVLDLPEPPESDFLSYDWAGAEGCGPTGWDCSRRSTVRHSAEPASVARAASAAAALLPIPGVDFVDWDALSATIERVADAPELNTHRVESARRGMAAGVDASARTAAGELGSALDVAGRRLLGAAAALERFAARSEGTAETRSADLRNLGL